MYKDLLMLLEQDYIQNKHNAKKKKSILQTVIFTNIPMEIVFPPLSYKLSNLRYICLICWNTAINITVSTEGVKLKQSKHDSSTLYLR